MRIISYLFLGAAIISAACATIVSFKTEDALIHVENGYYKATIYYKYDDEGKSYLRYDYSEPITMTELIDYSKGTRSKVCGSTCETGFYPYGAPALFQQDGDIATGEEDGDCREYTPAVNYAVTSIWYRSDNSLCRATLADNNTLIFKKPIDTTFKDYSVFDLEGKQCPAPICKRVMDLVFVIDNSGSVSRSDWQKAKDFIINVTNSFDIGTDATMIGVVSYDYSAKTVIELSGNKESIITAVDGAKYVGGTTCTGCGIDLAMKFFNSTTKARNELNPEKMMIVVTDGENNELDNYNYCRKWKSTCTDTNKKKCIRYECKGNSHKANGPICLESVNTTTCLKKVCSSCKVKGKCLKYGNTCVNTSTTRCAKRSTTYCNGNPSSYCCSISNGKLSNYYRCGKCECTDYRCDKYACEEYNCLLHDCNDCESYSEECLIYKQRCTKYEQIDVCDVDEECAEYECTKATLTCDEWGKGANSLLAGAVSRTRTKWALMPASNRLPIVIAIGVSRANKYELMGIASTLEGKQLIYTVSDYSKLAGIINDLVDETCTKQTTNLEKCAEGCNGLCGCNRQCYCPKCDEPEGSCYSIDCRTDNTTSTGCVVTHKTCSTDDKCVIVTADNSTTGCCKTDPRNCVKSTSKCKIYGCNSETGCTEKDVVCVPSSACFVSTCDPERGCVETPACDTSDKCLIMSCDVVNGKKNCTYTDKCTSPDPCMNPVCNPDTGACSLDPVVCTPKDHCHESSCFNGACINTENITKMIECSGMATDSCEKGYCNPVDGSCVVEKLEGAENCKNCDMNTTVNCSKLNNECFMYECAGLPSTDPNSPYPVECIPVSICNSTNPCMIKECVADKCVQRSPCGEPEDACTTIKCVEKPLSPLKYECIRKSTVGESDECWIHTCNSTTGLPDSVSTCKPKKCGKFEKCTLIEKKADCVYTPTHNCTSNMCFNSFCDEETGECVYEDLTSRCMGDDPCTIYWCDNSSGCRSKPVVCNDNKICTDDACVPLNETEPPHSPEDIKNGYVCVFTPRCPRRSYCENSYCDINGNCTYSDYACDGTNETKVQDDCHTLVCNETAKACVNVMLASAFLDVCGACVQNNKNLTDASLSTVCIAGMKMPDFAAAIGGAAVAGIVIAAIIVAAILGVSSALGTKELIKRAKKNADVGTNSNPLYEGNDNEASNPAFTGEN